MRLVQVLAAALGTRGAWVTEFDVERRRLRALAFWLGGQWLEDWEAAVDGTPCQVVVETRKLVHYPDRVVDLHPHDPSLRGANAVSYMGVPLLDLDGSVLGHLAVVDVQPMPDDPIRRAMFEIFAGRAAAELRRLRVGRQVRSRQVGGFLINAGLHANPRAARGLGGALHEIVVSRRAGGSSARSRSG